MIESKIEIGDIKKAAELLAQNSICSDANILARMFLGLLIYPGRFDYAYKQTCGIEFKGPYAKYVNISEYPGTMKLDPPEIGNVYLGAIALTATD